MKDYKSIFDEDCFYHIYNRTNGSDLLFREDRNYRYFLEKYKQYLSKYLETFSYCLLPNHFHFLVKVKQQNLINDEFELSKLISESFRRFFMSYSKSYNKAYNRTGNLFQAHFNRLKIKDEINLKYCIAYIHLNPVLHGLVDSPNEWNYSSYSAFFSSSETKVQKDDVIELFDDLRNFEFFHNKRIAEKYLLANKTDY